jgi:hypothetical protein
MQHVLQRAAAALGLAATIAVALAVDLVLTVAVGKLVATVDVTREAAPGAFIVASTRENA